MKTWLFISYLIVLIFSFGLSFTGINELAFQGGPCGGGLIVFFLVPILIIYSILFFIALLVFNANIKYNQKHENERDFQLARLLTIIGFASSVYLFLQATSANLALYLILPILYGIALFFIPQIQKHLDNQHD